MVVFIHFATFIAAITMTASFMLDNKRVDSIYLLLGILVILNSLGRYMISISTTIEMALCGNIFNYVGGCFCPAILILVIARLCNETLPKWLVAVLFSFTGTIMALVLTIGKLPVYYANVELGFAPGGYSYLIKTYGPAHKLYPVLMLFDAVVLGVYQIKAIRNNRNISFKSIFPISMTGTVVIATYIIERLVHSTLSLVSIAYLFSAMVVIRLFERVYMYDMTNNIANYVERMKTYGYIAFDKKFRYVNSNDYAKQVFPEIAQNWRIDFPIPESDSFLYQEIFLPLKNHNFETKTFFVNDIYVEIIGKPLTYKNGKQIGYILEIVDCTIQKKYLNTVENYNEDLKREITRQTEHIYSIKDKMVLGIASIVESRDNSTGNHIMRTSAVVKIFADALRPQKEKLGITEDFLQMLIKAAPMHDLGKLSINDVILRKNGKYTQEEYRIMQTHSTEGAKIIEKILRNVEDDSFVEIAKNVAHFHHEKWDGTGYPQGLKGREIPVEARIMALADVFDALISKRCYKESFSFDESFEFIKQNIGTHFDPDLAVLFLSCRCRLEKLYASFDREQ